MRRLILLIAGVLILVAVALPTAAIYYLAFTEGGFQLIVSRIPHKIGSFDVELINASGSVAHGIRIEQLDIDYHLVHLTFKDMRARVELLPLLLQTIRTKGASIDTVIVEVKRRKKPSIASTPIFLPRWLVVRADDARIANVKVAAYNGAHLEVSNIYASGIGRHRQIRFFEVGGQIGNARIDGSGTMQAYDPLRLDMQTKIHWTPPAQPAWSLDVTGVGDLNILNVTAHTVAPFRSDFSGQALGLASQLFWRGNAIVHDFDVTAWGGDRKLGLLSGQLALKGNSHGFAARGPLESSGLKAGVFDTQFEGTYAHHVLWAKHMEITHRASGSHASGEGTIEMVKDGPKLDLRGSWRDFQWPLMGKVVPFHSASADFTVSGTWPYSVHVAGVGQAGNLPPMPATIDGTLAKDRFTFNRADIDLYEGHATLTGEAVWSPRETWVVTGHVSDVNPASVRADLPGKLSFNIATQGVGFGGNGDFSVEVHDIGGRLRGVPASGGGKFGRSGSVWQFDKVRLVLGGTNLAVDGHLDDTFDLRFAVTSKDLSLLAAESRGQL
ncbi:MAG: hypothetical protein JO042_15930, partial [Sinobacteraceae bacterium]|nr:hypothetical protein [Nevskiaceae bacterium]